MDLKHFKLDNIAVEDISMGKALSKLAEFKNNSKYYVAHGNVKVPHMALTLFSNAPEQFVLTQVETDKNRVWIDNKHKRPQLFLLKSKSQVLSLMNMWSKAKFKTIENYHAVSEDDRLLERLSELYFKHKAKDGIF